MNEEEGIKECKRLVDELFNRRIQLGMSQAAVAGKMGIYSSYVSAIERGDRLPSTVTLARYAGAVGLRIHLTTDCLD